MHTDCKCKRERSGITGELSHHSGEANKSNENYRLHNIMLKKLEYGLAQPGSLIALN